MSTREELRAFIDQLTKEELKTLRAMINGKLSKRMITAADQAKMQKARKKAK